MNQPFLLFSLFVNCFQGYLFSVSLLKSLGHFFPIYPSGVWWMKFLFKLLFKMVATFIYVKIPLNIFRSRNLEALKFASNTRNSKHTKTLTLVFLNLPLIFWSQYHSRNFIQMFPVCWLRLPQCTCIIQRFDLFSPEFKNRNQETVFEGTGNWGIQRFVLLMILG